MFQNASLAHSSANASRKLSRPTQFGVPMMLHSVNATYAPKRTGRMLKTRKGTAKKATKT